MTKLNLLKIYIAWKVSKYGVISGRYFVLGLNTEKYGPEITPYLDNFQAAIRLPTEKINNFNIFIQLFFPVHLCQLSFHVFLKIFIFVSIISIAFYLFYHKPKKCRAFNYVKHSILDVFGSAIYYSVIIIIIIIIIYRGW